MERPGGHLEDIRKRTSSPIHPRDHRLQQCDHCCHDQRDRKEDACLGNLNESIRRANNKILMKKLLLTEQRCLASCRDAGNDHGEEDHHCHHCSDAHCHLWDDNIGMTRVDAHV